jgi:hypothetical protein
MPLLVGICCQWITHRLENAGRQQVYRKHVRKCGEWFRADARASKEGVAVGGWECLGNTPPKQARWFAVELTRDSAPWAFTKEKTSQLIASLGLFATFLCVILFVSVAPTSDVEGSFSLSGVTDNQGNQYVANKLLTTKYPLCCVLMELVEQLDRRRAWLDLTWRRRNENTLADALANFDFEAFSTQRRVEVDLRRCKLHIMGKLMVAGSISLTEGARVVESKRRRTIPKETLS